MYIPIALKLIILNAYHYLRSRNDLPPTRKHPIRVAAVFSLGIERDIK